MTLKKLASITVIVAFSMTLLAACGQTENADNSFSVSDGVLFCNNNKLCVLDGIDPNSDDAFDAVVIGDNIYAAYFADEENGIAIETSHDSGSSFETHYVTLETYDAGSVYLAFSDENEGLLLYCSSPAAGQMTKLLYRTENGCESFAPVADLTDTIENYPTALAACGTAALILTQNHGSADYAFRSDDSGATWKAYHPKSISEDAYNYIDGVSIAQNADGNWTLTLCGVTSGGKETFSVVSTDKWATWK